jgi:hypothetical protein
VPLVGHGFFPPPAPTDTAAPLIGEQEADAILAALKPSNEALGWITSRYGTRTADFVAMQLEYPRPGASQ